MLGRSVCSPVEATRNLKGKTFIKKLLVSTKCTCQYHKNLQVPKVHRFSRALLYGFEALRKVLLELRSTFGIFGTYKYF